MSKPVVLCADSTCDLDEELIQATQVHLFPLHITLDGENYRDGVDIHPDDIYRAYDEKKVLPKTAAANMEEYADFCRPFIEAGNEVVFISLGGGLSSTMNNCRMAAEELDGMYTVDSGNLSTGSGLVVLEAARLVAEGKSAKEVAEKTQEFTKHVHASFVLDTLEYLYKGGRCSALAMFGANLLQLKPGIEVNNADGTMTVGKKYRGSRQKSMQQYVRDKLEGRTDIVTDHVFLTHSGLPEEELAQLKKIMLECQPFKTIFVTRAGCTISSHCGPNCMGVLFVTK